MLLLTNDRSSDRGIVAGCSSAGIPVGHASTAAAVHRSNTSTAAAARASHSHPSVVCVPVSSRVRSVVCVRSGDGSVGGTTGVAGTSSDGARSGVAGMSGVGVHGRDSDGRDFRNHRQPSFQQSLAN